MQRLINKIIGNYLNDLNQINNTKGPKCNCFFEIEISSCQNFVIRLSVALARAI